MADFQETSVAMFSQEAILAKIQKYHQNKVKEKGWMKINKEIKDYWENKKNKKICVPCYFEANEEEKMRIREFHFKLSQSENPLEGWNFIKERSFRNLHKILFKRDKEYRRKAKMAIYSGLPFCPLQIGVVYWITTEDVRNEEINGLCYFCFKNGIYHELLSVKGTQLWEKDVFTKQLGIKISKKEKRKFFKDGGKTRKEQKKRIKRMNPYYIFEFI